MATSIKTMKEVIKNEILDNQKLSDNKCGTTFIFLQQKLGFPRDELKVILEELRQEKFIVVRKGINHNLIFLK